MLRNYFLVTLRNLLKNRLYSFINIAGLAIGITCSILIILWVSDELSYDAAIPKGNHLQQVYVNAEFNGKINTWRSVPLPTYEAMKTADANIARSCVTGWGGTRLIAIEENRLMKESYYVSEEFLEMFEFPLKIGNSADVLDDPSSIVITESLARALFGDADPMNQMIKVNDESLLKVTGILEDIPKNSSFQFDFLMTWKHRESTTPWVVRNTTNWGNYSFQVFVELGDELKHSETQSNIKDMLTENGEDDIKRELFLHPLLEWRLRSNFENGVVTGGLNDYVQLFTVIAIFILIIACINFMNLATARSERRAKEVGIRKSIGSKRIELVFQFLGESLLIAFIAFVTAILLTQLILPFYNNLVDKQLFIDYTSMEFWLFALAIIAFTGLVSGSYPAFYLSSFTPVKTLKGSITAGKSATTPRKVLVVMQFGFAIFLMVGTVIIFKQIELVKNRELGYQQEKLITVYTTDELDKNYKVLKQEMLQSGSVEAVTRSNSAITSINSNNFIGWPGKPEELRVIFTTIATEYDYAKTMGIKILQGRDFSEDFKSDTAAVVINQAGLDLMNLEDPIGTQLDLWGDKVTLIGVVDNVLMGSPYTEVKPMFMIMDPEWGGTITVRLAQNKEISESLPAVKALFEKHNPAYPFDYSFADQDFQKKFKTINMTSNLASLFAFLAILITGLGLFGLASYTAEQRTKEIGIRKVLGASVMSLIALMSKEFSRLVLVGFLISAPIAWWLLDKYLERYEIRTEISWWIFPLTGLIALIYAIIIVTYQARRAATANPVNSLRNE
ncbi:MAG: ABC transporter permease [Bacteroidetes bacterium]|nr:MAG: ABC transporter permease [Bacteroidota bacterium]